MKKLKIATRLYLLVTLFLCVIAVPQTRLAFENLNAVRNNKIELGGLRVAAALRNLSIRTALARGATRAHLASKETAFLDVRRNSLAAMQEATIEVDKLEADLAMLPESRAKWPEVREAIQAVSKLNFDSADESFRIFSNLVERVNDLDRSVLNESALVFDHEPMAFHLVLIAFENLNDSSEFIGRSRALVTAALFRGRIIDQDRILFQALMNQNLAIEKKIEEHLTFLSQGNESAAAKIRPIFQEYEAARTEFQVLAQEAIDGDVRGGEAATRVFSLGTKTIETQSKLNAECIHELELHFASRIRAAYFDLLITSVFSIGLLGIVFFAAYLTVRSIRASIRIASNFAERVASGDLSERMEVIGRDEMAEILNSLNRMAEGLANSVRSIRDSSTGLSESSGNLVDAAGRFSATSEEQSAAVEEISAAAEELSASAARMSESMNAAVKRIVDTKTSIGDLVESNRNVATSLDYVLSAFQSTSQMAVKNEEEVRQVTASMAEILAASDKIQEFVQVITEISDRTNLLALNAAIEAARAGDAGRGFAVVASEITRLADLTQKSAKQVQSIIGSSVQSIRGGTEKVSRVSANMRAILEAISRVNREASAISDDTRRHTLVVQQITENVEMVRQVVTEVNAGTSEQQRASREVELSITEIATGSQDNTDGALKLVGLAEALNGLAQEMRKSAEKFVV